MPSDERPSLFNLEHLKKEAKHLLRACRAGDAKALVTVQAALPHLRALDIDRIARTIQLADVHQALARQRGFESWADLVRQGDPLARLLAAVRGGHWRTLRRDLRDFAGLGSSNVYAASALGDEDALERHLERDPALATTPLDGWPPLMYVCASPLGRLSTRHAASLAACAERLLEHGADPAASAPDESGAPVPAVMRGIMSGNMAVFTLLLKRGVHEPFEAGRAWLQSRATAGEADMHRMFGEYFRRPDVKAQMQKALDEYRAAGGGWPVDPREAQQLRMPNMLHARAHLWQAMLDRGFTPGVTSTTGQTGLHAVATYAPAAFVAMYLDRGGDPNVRDADGRSVIATAVRAGNREVAELLRNHGVEDDATPVDRLLGACLAGEADEVRRLVAADPDLPHRLTREDADTLVRAAGRGALDQVRLMLDAGISIDAWNEAGATALHQAAWRGQVDVVRLLIERGASLDVADTLYGQPPRVWALHGALHAQGARDRCLEAAQLLEDAERT